MLWKVTRSKKADGEFEVNLSEVLERIACHESELRSLGLSSIQVFGSVARGDATDDSDVDLLVSFSQPVGLIHFARARRRLSEILSCRVDMTTIGGIRKEIRNKVLSEAIHAA